MVEFLGSWAKGLGLAIVIVTILEMLLPNNKTKKYIRMVMGIYVLFQIIAPVAQNQNLLDINQLDLSQYSQTQETIAVNQKSMDDRIEELYQEELKKDITKKIEEKGYLVNKCNVQATMKNKEEETYISKIQLKLTKDKTKEKTEETKEESTENKIVTEIQKIKKVDTTIQKEQKENTQKSEKLDKSDVQNIKKFLIQEYGVKEKCLEIN